MDEYRLSSDQLCAKDFRRIQSSRRGYFLHGKRDWIAAIKKVHKRDGQVFAGYLQDNLPHLYSQGVWLFGDWNKALCAAGFAPEQMRLWAFWDQTKLIRQIQGLRKREATALCQVRARQSQEAVLGCTTSIRVVAKGSIAANIEIPKYAYGRCSICAIYSQVSSYSCKMNRSMTVVQVVCQTVYLQFRK
jgi:hypothetical protein